jgi:uncharacterized protein YodC (DUF2158 family)
MAFKPGDVVLLRSGGPSMTVVAVDEDEIKCVWIGEGGELFRESLPPVVLDLVETEFEEDDENGEDDDEQVEGGDDDADDDGADDDGALDKAEDRSPRRAGKG